MVIAPCDTSSTSSRSARKIPEIADRDRLRRSLCAADAIYLPDPERSTAGIHLVNMLRALGTHPMKAEGAAPITELLPPKTTKAQSVSMVDEHFGGIGHLISVM